MKKDLRKMNQLATELTPGDVAGTGGNQVEVCYFAVPDFTDAVPVSDEADHLSGETLPVDVGVTRMVTDNVILDCCEEQSGHSESLAGVLNCPKHVSGGASGPDESSRVGLQQRIAEIRLSCDPLVKLMTRKIEPGATGLFLFCDVDTPLRSGQACLAVARELAVHTGRKVLVIDSDLESSSLSRRLGLEQRSGTREMLRAMNGWQRLVLETDVENLTFMPCGTQKLCFTEPSSFVEGVLRKSLGEMTNEYAVVLVTTGSAFDNSLHAWRGLCSGTCLVLDSDLTSRSIAQAAVRELNASGCRVMGCLPTFRPAKPVKIRLAG